MQPWARRLALYGLCVLAVPAWAINKCTGPDGKVVFQDLPCAGRGEAIDVRPSRGAADAGGGADASDALQQLQQMRRQNDLMQAIREHRPLVGMTVDQVQQAIGNPVQVNNDTSSGALRQQAIYEFDDVTWYVYTRDGVVDYIQERAPTIARQARSSKRCATRQEIDQLKTSASSIALSVEERVEMQKRIRDMENCR